MNDNVFERACLIQMTTSVWSASKAVDPVLLKKLGEHSDWLKGRKNLVNPELLGQVRTAVHSARNKIKQYALPFPIMSIQLVPKEYISTIENILQEHEKRYWDKVEEFISLYSDARREAREILGELFNEMDYPLNIRDKFKFGWQFLALEVPSQSTILSPELYEREKQRFENLMYETRELCMQALRNEFLGLISELTDKLTESGQPKKIVTNSMFNKLNQFFADLETKNIFSDETLVELTENAKQVISNVSPCNLKYDEQAREQIKSEIKSVQRALEDSIVDLPRRTIRMENLEAA